MTDRRTTTATYKILRRLGKGGMAEVFLAQQEGIAGVRRLAVVKKILPQFSEVETVAEMLLDEARIAIQLSHPNIVQIYELGKDDGQYFIAMEFVDGCDLATLARVERHRQSRIPMRLALRVVSEAAMGLDYAHRQRGLDGRPLNLVHRDVSPHNLMCSREGAVKVTDFGIAKAVGKVQVTEVGVVKGKVQYMSPEQYTGAEVDHRADIFSLGVVLYQLTTGRLPRAGKSGDISMRRVIEGQIPRPTEVRPEYPEVLEEIVMRALAQNPDDRYPDAASLRDDVLDFARQHDLLAFPKELGAYVEETIPQESGRQGSGDGAPHRDAGKILPGRRARIADDLDTPDECDTAQLGTDKVSRIAPKKALAAAAASDDLPLSREQLTHSADPDRREELSSEAIIESAAIVGSASLEDRALLTHEELTPMRRSRVAAEIASEIELLEEGESVAPESGQSAAHGADSDVDSLRASLRGAGVSGLADRAAQHAADPKDSMVPLDDAFDDGADEAISPHDSVDETLRKGDIKTSPEDAGLADGSRAPTHLEVKKRRPSRLEPSVEVDDSIIIDPQTPRPARPPVQDPSAGTTRRPSRRKGAATKPTKPRSSGGDDWAWGGGTGAGSRGTERVVHTGRSIMTRGAERRASQSALWALALVALLGVGGLVFLASHQATNPDTSGRGRVGPPAGPANSAILDVLANPTEARVMVDGAQRCASTPCRIEALPLGTFLVTVKSPGYRLWNQRVVLSAARSRVVLNPTLEKAKAEVGGPGVVPPVKGPAVPRAKTGSGHIDGRKPKGRSSRTGKNPGKRSGKKPGKRPAGASKRPPGAAAGKGAVSISKVDAKVALISVDVRPAWAEVWVDGKLVGPTPIQRAIPAGPHTVELKNPKYSFHRVYKLNFKLGENVKIKERITPAKKPPAPTPKK